MKSSQILMMIGLTAVLVFGFQNCSKVGVSNMENPTLQKAASFEQELNDTADDAMVPPKPEDPKSPEVSDDDPKKRPENPPVVKDREPKNDEPSEDEMRNICLEKGVEKKEKESSSSKKSLLVSGSKIENLRGYHMIESDKIDLIQNIRGKMIVKAKSDGAQVLDIIDTRGALIICGMDVQKIENTRGHLVLVNSRVQSLVDHRGNVKMLGSEIKSTSNIRGQISEVRPK